MSTRTATWSSIGTDVSSLKTIDEVLKDAKLDYEVEKVPLQALLANGEVAEIKDRVATVRKDNGKVKGIVSPTYRICQNKEAFDFVHYIGEDSGLKFVKAGETQSGMVYVIASLPSVKILDDDFEPYVIFQNGHNGGTSVRAAISPLRIVCQNQFNVAFKEAQNAVSIRHTSQLESKLDEAQKVLRSTALYMGEVDKFAQKYANVKVSDAVLNDIVENCFPITADATPRMINTMTERRAAFLSAYNEDDNGNFRGTAWGLINGMSDFISHQVPGRKTDSFLENRFTAVTFDPRAMMAFIELVNAKAGVSA